MSFRSAPIRSSTNPIIAGQRALSSYPTPTTEPRWSTDSGLAELAEIKASYEDSLSHDGSNELARQTELREVAATEVAKVLDAQNTEVERVIGVVCRDVNAGLELIGTGIKQVQRGLTEIGNVNGVQTQARKMINDLQERLDAALLADQ